MVRYASGHSGAVKALNPLVSEYHSTLAIFRARETPKGVRGTEQGSLLSLVPAAWMKEERERGRNQAQKSPQGFPEIL